MLAQNIIRVGVVSSSDPGRQAIRATFPDRDDQVSDWLPVIIPPIKTEYTVNGETLCLEIEIPKLDEEVLCIFLGNGLETGFCVGKVGI